MKFHYIYNQEHMGDNLIVPWWSITKTAIAVLTYILHDQGVVDLDATYLDMNVSLQSLLTHTSGMDDYGGKAFYHEAVDNGQQPWSFPDLLTKYPWQSHKGFYYSNIGYGHINRILENASGKSIDLLLKQYVFEPLDLKDVQMIHQAMALPGLRPGYDPDWVYHGLLIGSLASGCTFLEAIFSGFYFGPDLLERFKTVHFLEITMPDRPFHHPGYASGMMVDVHGNLTRFGHNGGGPDSFVLLYHFPERQMTAMAYSASLGEADLEHAFIEKIKMLT